MKSWRIIHPDGELHSLLSRFSRFLHQSTSELVRMQETLNPAEWKSLYKEIRTLEHQGDALLTEFREEMSRCVLLSSGHRKDLMTIAMSMDDCLDVVKDAANALLIYQPAKLDSQLKDICYLIQDEAKVLDTLMPKLRDVKKHITEITLLADRINELEHDADEAYEAYVGYIFAQEEDLREMTKYKNLAELYEKATDSGKHVADCIRILAMRYVR